MPSAKTPPKPTPKAYNDAGEEIVMSADQVDIVRTGTKIILPEPMSFDEGIEWLKRKRKEDEVMVGIYHDLPAFPLDGAYAFAKAIEKIYGWSSAKATMITMSVSSTNTVQVPWGKVEIPGIEGELMTGLDTEAVPPKFVIRGNVKAKHRGEILKLYEETKKILRDHSVYRGKAIRVDFSYIHRGRGFDPLNDEPKFMDISKVKTEDLIFERDTHRAIRMAIFTALEKASSLRLNGVPIRRGILLAGPYGTGKTMTANVTAKVATDNSFTFIYVKNVEHLAHALRFAANYAPAVLFGEDIDRVVSGERSSQMDEILNTLDGVDTKHADIITVLTTNHLNQINPAMLRPGRLDAVIEVQLPDSEAAAKLIRVYGRRPDGTDLLSADFDFHEAGNALKGHIPAVIRECVERAKTASIDRLEDGTDLAGKVTAEDVVVASIAMKNQIALIKIPDVDSRSPLEKFGAAMGESIAQGIRDSHSFGEAEEVLGS